MFSSNYYRPQSDPANRRYVGYKDRQTKKEITDKYDRRQDIETLEVDLKEVQRKRELVDKKYRQSLRGLVEGKDYVAAKKTWAENMKPVDFEHEVINARIEAIKKEKEDIL